MKILFSFNQILQQSWNYRKWWKTSSNSKNWWCQRCVCFWSGMKAAAAPALPSQNFNFIDTCLVGMHYGALWFVSPFTCCCFSELYVVLIQDTTNWSLLAAFTYPRRTRPNSGILVLKISTEPIRSWCCLHIHAKFWSTAAVDDSGPISISLRMIQQCLQLVCVIKTWHFHGFILFSFTFG